MCYIYFMLKLKTKWFSKWAIKNSVSDEVLLKTIIDLAGNLNTADLGGGLFKVRTPREGYGKSKGFRTIIIYKGNDKAIFVYGFSKSEKENLDRAELNYFKNWPAIYYELEMMNIYSLLKMVVLLV